VREALDDDGVGLRAMDQPAGREGRFRKGRNGDHLMVPFQCELFHFWNIMKEEPRPGFTEHGNFMRHVCRCNLDAMWSREPRTMASNLDELCRVKKAARDFGTPSLTPVMGPFPLADSSGMKAALAVLHRSQCTTRKYETHVQPNAHRKVQVTISNVSRAGVEGLGDQVGAHERNKVWISHSATHQFWFSRFMIGIKKRTGQVVSRTSH
jgi:hypothetical protein